MKKILLSILGLTFSLFICSCSNSSDINYNNNIQTTETTNTTKRSLETVTYEIEEGDYDLLVGCVHKDAAATYFITYYHILKCKALAIVFSRDGDEVAEFADMVESSTDADIIAVRAFHNPNPIKVKFDKYLKTLEE